MADERQGLIGTVRLCLVILNHESSTEDQRKRALELAEEALHALARLRDAPK